MRDSFSYVRVIHQGPKDPDPIVTVGHLVSMANGMWTVVRDHCPGGGWTNAAIAIVEDTIQSANYMIFGTTIKGGDPINQANERAKAMLAGTVEKPKA